MTRSLLLAHRRGQEGHGCCPCLHKCLSRYRSGSTLLAKCTEHVKKLVSYLYQLNIQLNKDKIMGRKFVLPNGLYHVYCISTHIPLKTQQRDAGLLLLGYVFCSSHTVLCFDELVQNCIGKHQTGDKRIFLSSEGTIFSVRRVFKL